MVLKTAKRESSYRSSLGRWCACTASSTARGCSPNSLAIPENSASAARADRSTQSLRHGAPAASPRAGTAASGSRCARRRGRRRSPRRRTEWRGRAWCRTCRCPCAGRGGTGGPRRAGHGSSTWQAPSQRAAKALTRGGTARNGDVLCTDVWHVHKAGSTAPSRWRTSLLIQISQIRQNETKCSSAVHRGIRSGSPGGGPHGTRCAGERWRSAGTAASEAGRAGGTARSTSIHYSPTSSGRSLVRDDPSP